MSPRIKHLYLIYIDPKNNFPLKPKRIKRIYYVDGEVAIYFKHSMLGLTTTKLTLPRTGTVIAYDDIYDYYGSSVFIK